MLWGWLKALVQGFFAAFFRVAAKEIRTQLEKPRTIEDANTPKNIKDAVDADVRDKLKRMRES
jgi:hypothetical protein